MFRPVVAQAEAAAMMPAAGLPVTTLVMIRERDLRFGTMVVIDSGARIVHASGELSDEAVLPMGHAGAGPAQFTVSYDRGTDDSAPVSIIVQLILASVPPVATQGLVGALSDFETDLPGASRLDPGHPVTATIANCTTRVCSLQFRVGARLQVTRANGGGSLSISPPITATLLAVQG